MKEDFLHYSWKTKQFSHDHLTTEDGQRIEIISPGDHNYDSGPDFFNAKIKIGEVLWSGNVEIHLRASDWLKHNHQFDDAYDNVILHVIHESDCKLNSNAGNFMPTLVLKNRIDEKLYYNYLQLQGSKEEISCSQNAKKTPSLLITNWLSRLIAERLERKTNELKVEFEQNKNDWEETFYRHLSRQFGMKVNAEPFQWLASSLPFRILFRHRDNLLQTEALLFGQSGLFPVQADDAYTKTLIREYKHLQSKYNLTPMPSHQWKFMRLRPNNFPTLRIAQLAGLVFRQPQLFRKCMETTEISEFKTLFNIPASGYWKDHYRFEKISRACEKNLGSQAIDIILINTIAPFKFLYGRMKGDENLQQEAISLLEKIDSETNKIIREWEMIGIKGNSAAESQALIELKKNYCEKKKCVDCSIGNYLMEKG
jgi:hypothetical protein